MDTTAKTIQNNILATMGGKASSHVIQSIHNASRKTGVDFAYLVKQAGVESSFNPSAKAKTSSATGLYQFIESTWLAMVKKHGDKYGMGELAQHIDDRGRVDNKAMRKEILNLRKDPEKASALAAELANENKAFLERRWGGEIGDTELYLAHFMGAGGASEFLKARDENPLQNAAVIFPDAARSNRNVFYDARTGRARSIDEVYAFFDKKFDLNDSIPEIAKGGLEKPAVDVPARRSVMDAVVYMDPMNFGGDNIITPRMKPARSMDAPMRMAGQGFGYNNLMSNPVELMMLSQLDLPGGNSSRYND